MLPLTLAIAIVIAGIGGRTLSETSSTIDRINQVSTPPPRISDQTVRDDHQASVAQIDPTATAAAGGQPASQETAGSRESTTDSSGGSIAPADADVSAIPAPTVAVELPAAAAPDASTGAGESEVPSVAPQGAGGRAELDQDAAVDAPGSSDLAPSSTSPGEPSNGEFLAEQQLAGGMTFDTAPAVAAIAQEQQEENAAGPSSSDSGGLLGAVREEAGEIRDAAEGAAIAAGVSDPESQPLTILIMGVDARPGSAIDIGVRPDALMVLRLDPVAGSCKGLAVPRDSYVELPGYGNTKINHALMLGGIPYQQLVVESYLGIEIDHYALIDFTGFAELVDSVGGITIDVPPNLASPAVAAGIVTIDGEQALLHARYRGSGAGDFDRIRRQQSIMRGLIDAAGGRDLLGEATRLMTSLQDHIRTDLTLDEMVSLARLYQDQCTAAGLDMDQIPGEVVYGPLIDPLFNLPLSYVVSDLEAVASAVDTLISASPAE
jgi:LCP family protein required for cell wall assembly